MPLRLRNASEQIAERLVTAIALGEFVPGQRLPSERELAGLLSMSRASVRDALHLLAGAGYVDIQRGRTGGAYVRTSWGAESAEMIRRTLVPNWQQFEALFDLRSLVEPLIARTAAERRTRPGPRGDRSRPSRSTSARPTGRHRGRQIRRSMRRSRMRRTTST